MQNPGYATVHTVCACMHALFPNMISLQSVFTKCICVGFVIVRSRVPEGLLLDRDVLAGVNPIPGDCGE